MNRILFGLGFALYSTALFGLGYSYHFPDAGKTIKEAPKTQECPRLTMSAYECVLAHKELGYTKLFTDLSCREQVEEAYKRGQATFSPEGIK